MSVTFLDFAKFTYAKFTYVGISFDEHLKSIKIDISRLELQITCFMLLSMNYVFFEAGNPVSLKATIERTA